MHKMMMIHGHRCLWVELVAVVVAVAVAEQVSELIVDQPTVTMKHMLLKDSLTAWEHLPAAPPAAPMKISWMM